MFVITDVITRACCSPIPINNLISFHADSSGLLLCPLSPSPPGPASVSKVTVRPQRPLLCGAAPLRQADGAGQAPCSHSPLATPSSSPFLSPSPSGHWCTPAERTSRSSPCRHAGIAPQWLRTRNSLTRVLLQGRKWVCQEDDCFLASRVYVCADDLLVFSSLPSHNLSSSFRCNPFLPGLCSSLGSPGSALSGVHI